MIGDSHNDILTSGLCDEQIMASLSTDGAEGNAAAVILALFFSDNAVASVGAVASAVQRFCAFSPDILTAVAIENAGFVAEQDFAALAALPLKYISLTWNNDNRLAGGAHGEGRLTNLGKSLIDACHKTGVLIDTAHLNEQSFFDVVALGGRIINSHSCAKELCRHPRNLSDAQIKAIAESGGYIGITLVGSFLRESGNACSTDVVRHIDYIAERFGVDCIGLGTDFYGTENLPLDISDYKSMQIIVEKLARMGYNREAIEKITRKNFMRTFYPQITFGST